MNILCCSVFPSTTILFQIKGIGHEMDWNFVDMHTIDLSRPKKGPRQDFENFQMLLQKKKIFFLLLAVNANLPPLMLSACRWSKFYFFSLVRAAGCCFPLVGRIFYFYATISSARQSAFILGPVPPPPPLLPSGTG